ncbi:MAG: hypothetical protein KAX38_10070 [Candidatus Krumholzibacteria bacterium]|nr:hypothetical protein [Candidatus Krumholzibacteria bacterium]
MANYEPIMRSNCFKVKNFEAFRKDIIFQEVSRITFNPKEIEKGLLLIDHDKNENEIIMLGYCSIPHWRYSEECDEYIEFDFTKLIQKHIAPDSTCELMEIGHTKLRHVTTVHYKITTSNIKETVLDVSD